MSSIIKVIRQEIGLTTGDLLEARVERGRITLEPKAVLPRGVVQGLADLKRGHAFGPFTAGQAVQWLKVEVRKGTKSRRP